MFIKYLMLALAAFNLNSKRDTSNLQNNRDESKVLEIGFKLLIGFGLVQTILFSIIQLGNAFEVFLSQFENGFIFEFISFSVVVVVCMIWLYFLFNRKTTKLAEKNIKNRSFSNTIDLQVLVLKFAEGVMKGLESRGSMDRSIRLIRSKKLSSQTRPPQTHVSSFF